MPVVCWIWFEVCRDGFNSILWFRNGYIRNLVIGTNSRDRLCCGWLSVFGALIRGWLKGYFVED